MPIDPKSIKWDEAPAAPAIDTSGIKWDDETQAVAPAVAQEAPADKSGSVSRMLSAAGLGPIGSALSLLTNPQDMGNLSAGAVRGAGSIGATILAPYDMAKDALAGKGLSLESNRERRTGIDGGLSELGADTDSGMYKVGKLAGEIAGTAGAGPVLAGGAKAAGASAPIVAALQSGGLNVAGRTGVGGLLTRAGAGAAVGGASAGLVNPEDAGTGAIVGGALPVLAKGGASLSRATTRGAKSLVEPLYEAGRQKIVGRSLREFAGDSVDDAIRNLQSAKELVPGSLPTVGEAAGVPSLAALQRASVNVSPEAANAIDGRMIANNQARVDLLEQLSGSKGAREAAEAARDEAAAAAYGSAKTLDAERRALANQMAQAEKEKAAEEAAKWVGFGSLANAPKPVKAAENVLKPSAELLELAKRPTMQQIIASAKRLAADKGEKIGNPLESIDGLHYIKLAVDDALSGTPTNALARNQKAAVMDIKDRLIAEMDKVSPAYGEARKAFTEASRPINQMDIAEELKLAISPLNGKLRAAQYASKLKDETAARATGFKGATLANTLEPEQLGMLNAIRDDLARADFAANAGRAPGTNTIQNLAYSNMLNRVGVPNFLREMPGGQVVGGLLGRAGDAIYGKANKEVASLLADAMLTPQEAARLMLLREPERKALISAARKGLLGVSKAAPALVAD